MIASGAGDASGSKISVVAEREVYRGWRRMVQRDIQMPTGEVHTFDVLASERESVLVFPWCSATKSATLIREYSPACQSFDSGVVAGIVEKDKHASALEAAKFELEEEGHLTGGTWFPLLSRTSGLDKYNESRFHVFLVLDPSKATSPRALDDAEYIEIESGVSACEVRSRIADGQLSVVSSYTCLLALEKLRELNELP
jgi:hypothetical protein